MGLKAAAVVVAAGVGAYYVYTMINAFSHTPSSTATPARLHSVSKPMTTTLIAAEKVVHKIKPVPIEHGPEGFIGVGVKLEDAF
jgi:hypothetical protein